MIAVRPRLAGVLFCTAAALAAAALAAAASIATPLSDERKVSPSPSSITWRAFDASAFELAKKESRLVLLWMPAPWGHWDKIMGETTFTDPRVIKLVAEKFVPIQVDPLLRPDIYMRYGMGGWPTTAFLLPSGQPFYFPDASGRVLRSGGTFYAADPLFTYLSRLAQYHVENAAAAEASAQQIAEGILQRKETDEQPLTREILDVAATKVMEAYAGILPDPAVSMGRHPDVDAILLGLHYYVTRGGSREILDVALQVATDMARGGIRDQIGGGFHRFAADAAWRVPAFEKPLLVNAEMLQAYTDVYRVTGNGLYMRVAEGIADYVLGTLADPAGWFRAYQAADARLGEDGDYYTWTLEEARAALGEEERDVMIKTFDIGEWGEMVNSAPRRNVLWVQEGALVISQRLGISEDQAWKLLDNGRARLLAARRLRTAPPVGEILIVESHAAMATALLAYADARGRTDLRETALKAIDFAWENVRHAESGLMDRAWKPGTGKAGLAEIFSDQAQMLRALIAAHESTGEKRWLDRAIALAGAANRTFGDYLEGGWMDRIYAKDAPGLLSWPMRSLRDNAIFSESLLRLHHITAEPADGPYATWAREALESWADEFARYKEAAASFGLAAERAQSPPLQVLLIGTGPEGGPDGVVLEDKARALYHPWRIVVRMTPQAAAPLLTSRKIAAREGPSCVLCLGDKCAGPFVRQDNLRESLAAFLKAPAAPAAAGSEAGERTQGAP